MPATYPKSVIRKVGFQHGKYFGFSIVPKLEHALNSTWR